MQAMPPKGPNPRHIFPEREGCTDTRFLGLLPEWAAQDAALPGWWHSGSDRRTVPLSNGRDRGLRTVGRRLGRAVLGLLYVGRHENKDTGHEPSGLAPAAGASG